MEEWFLECSVASILVGPELVIPDVAGAIVIHDLKIPHFLGFEPVDFDRKGKTVNGYFLTLFRCDHFRCVFGHAVGYPDRMLEFQLSRVPWAGQSAS